MTEKKYAQLLDRILKELSSDVGNEIHQVELGKTLNVRPTFLMGLLTELKEKDLIEILPISGGRSAKIRPRGLVFFESGGFTKEWKDKRNQHLILWSSTGAAVASAVAAIVLLLVTYNQSKEDNSSQRIPTNGSQIAEKRLQVLEKKVDSLTNALHILSPHQKPDTVTALE